ncbi:MAG: hypothetical protein SGJ09_17750 [Phycisphaerae bacterium]|nr:hypothetical protein [Phycisphaerae bacterium]
MPRFGHQISNTFVGFRGETTLDALAISAFNLPAGTDSAVLAKAKEALLQKNPGLANLATVKAGTVIEVPPLEEAPRLRPVFQPGFSGPGLSFPTPGITRPGFTLPGFTLPGVTQPGLTPAANETKVPGDRFDLAEQALAAVEGSSKQSLTRLDSDTKDRATLFDRADVKQLRQAPVFEKRVKEMLKITEERASIAVDFVKRGSKEGADLAERVAKLRKEAGAAGLPG